MPPPQEQQQRKGAFAQKVEESLGVTPGTKLWSPYPFSGLNLQDSPPAIDDKEFAYLENFFRLGNGYLRTAWDVGTPLYTAAKGRTILPYFFFFNIGQVDYVIVFLDDGTAIQVQQSNGALTVVTSTPNTFYTAGGNLPICSQSGTQYLIIANNNTQDDYWLWDGKLLYGAGSGSPFVEIKSGGANYNTAPTITAFGGTGAGFVAVATVDGGSVNNIQVLNPGTGYGVGNVVQLAFSGGGSDSSAILDAHLSSGGVGAISITNQGSGYSSNPTVVFTGGGGTGAAATAVETAGKVVSIVVTNAGTGYITAPAVTFTGGGGTGASATALLTAAGVQSVSVVSAGSGFTSAPVLTLEGGGGGGAAAQAFLTGTSVSSISITAGGTGFFHTPTITISAPNSGVQATAGAVVANGQIIQVILTNAGSGYTGVPEITVTPDGSDTLAAGAGLNANLAPTTIGTVLVLSTGSGYTTAPAVVITPGSNNAAYATLDMMPFGVSGSALETFNSRVWLGNPFQETNIPVGGDFQVSAGGSLTDFSTSDGGVLFTNSDRFLRKQYIAIHQSNGYLYFFGDSSISVVSNIQTTGTTSSTTTFNYQNVDPQVGMAWRDTVQDFGRTILFANATGVYGLYGGAATKVSAKIDQLFVNAIFPPDARAVTPTSAVATIFNVKHYFIFLTVQDPETGAVRNVLAGWNEKEWSIFSQTPNLTGTATQEVDSLLSSWATDGSSVYPMFAEPSAKLTKRLTTKYYGTDQVFLLKDFLNLYLQAQDFSTNAAGIDLSVNMLSSGIAVQPSQLANFDAESVANEQYNSGNYLATLIKAPKFSAPFPFWPIFGTGTGGFTFDTLGVQMSTTSPDFALSNIVLAYLLNTALQ